MFRSIMETHVFSWPFLRSSVSFQYMKKNQYALEYEKINKIIAWAFSSE